MMVLLGLRELKQPVPDIYVGEVVMSADDHMVGQFVVDGDVAYFHNRAVRTMLQWHLLSAHQDVILAILVVHIQGYYLSIQMIKEG